MKYKLINKEAPIVAGDQIQIGDTWLTIEVAHGGDWKFVNIEDDEQDVVPLIGFGCPRRTPVEPITQDSIVSNGGGCVHVLVNGKLWPDGTKVRVTEIVG